VKITGQVKFRDVETGVWTLVADDGTTYLLDGGDRKIKKDGSRIEADGTVDNESLGIAMVGPRFVVKSYKFI
jgi:cob(I)alamin adenosyltransferase